jgi:hypothetical protein
MLNNSKRLLNSSSAELYKEENKSNGKARCFVCKKDHCDELYNEGDYFIHGRWKNKKLSDKVKGNEIVVTNKVNMINPCKCDKMVHSNCLIRYIMLNLTFKCKMCNVYFNIDYDNKTSRCYRLLTNFILIFILAVIHLGIYAVAIILLMSIISFEDIYYFWQFIIAIGVILINTLIAYFSLRCILNYLKYKQYDIKVFGYTKEEGDAKLTNHEIINFSRFLENKYNCNTLELIDKRRAIIHNENYTKNKIKLSKFIKENNNFYYISKSEANSRRSFHMLNTVAKNNIEASLKLANNKLKERSPVAKPEDNNIILIKQNIEEGYSLPGSVMKKEEEMSKLLNTIRERDSEIGETNNLKLSSNKAMPVEKIIQLQVHKKNRRISSKIDDFTKQVGMTNSYMNCDSIIEDI